MYTFGYDANDRLVTLVDQVGKRSTLMWAGPGVRTAVVDPLGNRTSYGYNGFGQVTAVTDPLGNRTGGVFDGAGLLGAVVDGLGKRTSYAVQPGPAATWTRTDTGIPQSGDGDGDDYGIGAIGCASATMCVASAVDGPTARFNGSTWTMLSGPGIPLRSISCPAATRCVGVAGNDAVTFDGSSWSALVALAPVRVDMAAVSCGSSTSCVGVTGDGEMQFYNGTTWTAPVVLDDNGFRYVSCPTTTFCVASGYEDSVTASG